MNIGYQPEKKGALPHSHPHLTVGGEWAVDHGPWVALPATARPPMEKIVRVLHLFSGYSATGQDTFKDVTERMSNVRLRGAKVRVTEIDWTDCDCDKGCPCADHHESCGNLLRRVVYERLKRRAARGEYRVIVAGIPCNSFCVARFKADGGAPPLRDRQHSFGLPQLSAALRAP